MDRQAMGASFDQTYQSAPESTQEADIQYRDLLINSLLEEYRSEKENAYLRQNLDKITADLKEIKVQLAIMQAERDTLKEAKEELTQIKGQMAVITDWLGMMNITQLTISCGGQVPRQGAPFVDAMQMLNRSAVSSGAATVPAVQAVQQQQQAEMPESPSEEEQATDKEKPEKTKAQKVFGIISNIVFYLCMVMLIVGAVTFAQNDDPEKSIFGFRYYYIKTASMEPVYPVGSVVITKSVSTDEIQVGDDITVYVGDGQSDSYLTHRVVEITTDQTGELAFRTKGVNNKANDPSPFNAKLVVGRVMFCIPVLGLVMTFVRDQLWLVIVIFVLLLALSFVLRILFTPEKPETEQAEKPKSSKKKAQGKRSRR